ncbi:MAG TPA: NADPH-dependent FMN reductase [Rhodospirillaceae bacterium]|nr:NADPH-dependent FMN reductase [Rhodospirillaceae bacterium]MAX64823.1 NADPH-dependent FMN reductase [Rhodospirillaceae bacterium]MBB58799.1 NADPH-dependent FMN reductase [Rhodospirillaceae bacterium]HAE03239.1 NADPH-dependent FMN reductase [Rhodospirillaceae bacterium]HAJ22689.1 NADPH-dependent FMN reductase [Rhodospirillaceae bacterium]|tara:strand:+ start:26765 stop:27343 length:579 start_codon:yes stop_codon:yes gene_type:complete
MTKPKILAFAGSAKQESLNKKILAVAVQGAQEAGAEVTVIDLRDYPMPIMDEDLEAAEGIPAKAKELRALFAENHGLLLACPEYNSSITPLLKNTLDWVSRPDQDGSGLRFFNDKTASLISASGGALGGLRGLVHVRAILGNIGVHVLPKQLAVSGATKLFNDDGSINDPDREKQLKDIGANLAKMTGKVIA